MGLEFALLVVLFIIFLISFCGLLQKIKQTYQQEQIIAERHAQRQASPRFNDSFLNSAFSDDNNRPFGEAYGGVFPGSPPPYTQYYADPPPTYDDLFKNEAPLVDVVSDSQRAPNQSNAIERNENTNSFLNTGANINNINNNSAQITVSTISV